MKTIVITGSSKGIGYGLAENFLKLGQQVILNGRNPDSLEKARVELAGRYPSDRIGAFAADMGQYDQVNKLWDYSIERNGVVDIWINNAGVGTSLSNFWELSPDVIRDLININVIGAMYGARVALDGFSKQGKGAFYNMEGLGSDGRRVAGLALYGTSKRALSYLTDSLAAEVKGTAIIVGALSPGMVLTDLVLKQYQGRPPEEWENTRRVFNILADHVETVTPFLAERVLENQKNGVRIKWLTSVKVLGRFMTARVMKRDLFEDLEL